ncbi:transaldolase family protein [Streptomyces sp. NPDC001185]|uniref:transaldolase family protein n=1 Tax=Streptomyces sp. NPDC001185 TaxID=3154380 RepID=UPI003330E6C7
MVACQTFTPVHLHTDGTDARVSIEVAPRLARDSDATIDQAQKPWKTVDQLNLLVKIPATHEGLTAITAVESVSMSHRSPPRPVSRGDGSSADAGLCSR